MAKSLEDLKKNYIQKYTLQLIVAGKDKSLLRSEMCCDVCGETHLAWEIHQIPYFEGGKLAANYEAGSMMLACEKCMENHDLKVLESDNAMNFDASNLAIKEILGK
ncbi:hypothetical protein [Desulfitobacterium sp.]|uniref:hypothetical protein n=1 Tax=Desulfitobacterium sp. TaxID=49981 RepID=UPI002B1FAB12|nr:hypothetical protein [Desulfitobacterium sp.]MEA4902121.1 hypothetical protein [Desulfitobacterium sp.]